MKVRIRNAGFVRDLARMTVEIAVFLLFVIALFVTLMKVLFWGLGL